MRKHLNIFIAVSIFVIVSSPANAGTFSGLPNSSITPGAINTAVTQDNIQSTICVPGYTKTIRPSSSYTTNLKKSQLSSGYSVNGITSTSYYEEDHLVPLEVGGNPTSIENLWPELWSGDYGAHEKDKLENEIHKLICSNKMSLDAGQKIFERDWVSGYKKYILGQPINLSKTTKDSTSKNGTNNLSSVSSSSTMPYIIGHIGNIMLNWNTYGFSKTPIVQQETLTDIKCLPISDADFVVKQDPIYGAQVTRDTQVTLTTLCNPDTRATTTNLNNNSSNTSTQSQSSTSTSFKMPGINGHIGDVLGNWNSYGFTNSPVIRQDVISNFKCLPQSNTDFIINQDPLYGSSVTKDTQVTLTIICNIDSSSLINSTNNTTSSGNSITTTNSPSTSGSSSNQSTTSSGSSTDTWPAGATGKCNDGTYTSAINHQGACSKHGGVAYWKP